MNRNNLSISAGDVRSNMANINETFRDIPDLEVHDSSHEEQDIFSDEDEWGLSIDQIDQ
jgi:hypothetical protein